MRKELADKFNQDVERYRRALLSAARKCDWDAFKTKAGNLFDYVEWVEVSEIENRFLRIFKAVLVVLGAVVIAITNMDVTIYPDLQRLRYSIIVLAIAASCFEVYFFIDYKAYMSLKTSFYKRRKERFVRNIEQDFREILREYQPSYEAYCTG